MSDAIITRIDEMGSRIDDLEKSIGELMTQAGASAVDVLGIVHPRHADHDRLTHVCRHRGRRGT